LHRKKLQEGGIVLPPLDDEPDWLRLIRFKPTHKSFHHLQQSYVDGRLHLTQLLEKGRKRLEDIELELKKETAQFDAMCNQFMNKDTAIT
jgi:hypothetical protein